jgi:hypothetical protein
VESPTIEVEIMPTSTIEITPTPLPFEMTVLGFGQGEIIPARFACTGENLSPEITWTLPPEGTESLALIFDDPDAPGGTWVHWILFNLPPSVSGLSENLATLANYQDGSQGGANSWGNLGYGGPCPPQGSTHNYTFTLYALDVALDLESGTNNQALLEAMDEHILSVSIYAGLFSR